MQKLDIDNNNLSQETLEIVEKTIENNVRISIKHLFKIILIAFLILVSIALSVYIIYTLFYFF